MTHTMHTPNELIKFPDLVKKLEHLGQQDKIEVLHADFDTGDVTVTFKEPCEINFNSVMDRIKFVELSPRLKVRQVDFKTGHLTVVVLDADKNHTLTTDEINDLKKGNFIMVIKSVRARTGWGLADAKRYTENARDELIRRGILH